ncbi:28330_t:CDS:2 [Dentiscutata erythropus]|uniref:28330_t:CDS:1 n=1 Tax=Dentiscutata erythropus TaxID=1348616 RepID=A0A9N9EQE1_9GLOM|nr:28330_t:CDS:2 [Dentiscutata erythropus]
MEYATDDQRFEAKTYLIEEYENFQKSELIPLNAILMDNNEEEENVNIQYYSKLENRT